MEVLVMNIRGRMILLFTGLLVSWIAVWGGNKLSLTYNPWGSLARGVSGGKGSILLMGLLILALFIGVVIFVQFIEHVLNGKRLNDGGDMFFMTIGATCFGFAFGAISAPAKISDGMVFWMSAGFNFLLLLGL